MRSNLGDVNHCVDPSANSECRVLWHVDLGADYFALHQSEHERRASLHEASCIDVPLGDDTVERRDHALVGLLLTKHADQGLLSRDVCLSYSDRRLLRIESQAVSVALLRRQPSLLD